MPKNNFCHVEIVSEDPEKTSKFYSSVFDWEIKFLEESRGYSMIYSDAYEFEEKNITKKIKVLTDDRSKMSGYVSDRLILGCMIFLNTVMIKKKVLDKIGYFNPNFRIGEDWELWLRIAPKYKILFLDDVLVGYRRHDTNLSKNLELGFDSRHRIVENIISGLLLEQ